MHTVLRALTLLATLAFGLGAESSGRYGAPSYSIAGIINTTTAQTDPIAPNSMVSLYGSDLAFSTTSAPAGKALPTELGSVSVVVGNVPSPLLYVSPNQVNFLIPASLAPGERSLRLVRQGYNGPTLKITLQDVAPALLSADSFAIAAHLDGTNITADLPASPGEIIVLYASGLGPPRIPLPDGEVAPIPPAVPPDSLLLERKNDLFVLLNGEVLDQENIGFAGLAAGSVGMYQINLILPDPLPENPEIRIRMLERTSPEGIKLATLPQ